MTDLFRVWKSKLSPSEIKECLNHTQLEHMKRVYPAFEDWQMNLNLHYRKAMVYSYTYFIMLLKRLYYSSVDSILLTFLKTYNSFSKFKKYVKEMHYVLIR